MISEFAIGFVSGILFAKFFLYRDVVKVTGR